MLPPIEPYTLILLVRGPESGTPLDDDLLDRLQEEHVSYIMALVERGKIVACGPLTDTPAATMRGIAVFRTDIEEACSLMATDPAVQAGRIAVQAMTWWVGKGQLP